MDSISPRRYQHHHHHQTLFPSPHNTHSSNSSTSSSSNNNNGNAFHNNTHQQLPPLTPKSPKPITTRSESTTTTYPTTFVQADSSSFKQVVQMLTGSNETTRQEINIAPAPSKNHMIPPIKTMPTKQHHQSSFKLFQRRNNLNINPLVPSSVFSSKPSSGFSPRNHVDVLSPSMLDFPSLVLSPVTPLIPDPFDRFGSGATGYLCSGNGSPVLDSEAEEKAIKEKSFFLHPSPATTPRDTEPPRLLPLFPTTSPKAEGASSPSS